MAGDDTCSPVSDRHDREAAPMIRGLLVVVILGALAMAGLELTSPNPRVAGWLGIAVGAGILLGLSFKFPAGTTRFLSRGRFSDSVEKRPDLRAARIAMGSVIVEQELARCARAPL